MGMNKGYSIKYCDKCGKFMRKGYRIYKNQVLCYSCYLKKIHIVGGGGIGYSLKEALDKVYEIKSYTNKKGYTHVNGIHFPKILIGNKFKIKLEK